MRSINYIKLFNILLFIGLFNSNHGYCSGNFIFRHGTEKINDDTQMLQNKINSGSKIYLGDSTSTYTISGTIFLKSDQYIYLHEYCKSGCR
jgi:hypothetical protein